MKANMQFKTQAFRNQKTGKEDTEKRTPRLVNVKSYNLSALVEFALDNNYIEGAKYELAKGIVKGVIEAQRALVKMGCSVSVDGWVKYEPRLKGSVDAKKRLLSAENNQIIVGVKTLKELKLALDDFTFTCVDNVDEEFGSKISYVYSVGHEDAHDKLYDACPVMFCGEGLADAGKAKFAFTDKAGVMHEFEIGEEITVEKTDTTYLVNSDVVIESMRTICLEEGSELDTAAGATAILPFIGGKTLTRKLTFA